MVFFMVFITCSKTEHIDTMRKKIESGMVSGQLNGVCVTNCLSARQYASKAGGSRFPKWSINGKHDLRRGAGYRADSCGAPDASGRNQCITSDSIMKTSLWGWRWAFRVGSSASHTVGGWQGWLWWSLQHDAPAPVSPQCRSSSQNAESLNSRAAARCPPTPVGCWSLGRIRHLDRSGGLARYQSHCPVEELQGAFPALFADLHLDVSTTYFRPSVWSFRSALALSFLTQDSA